MNITRRAIIKLLRSFGTGPKRLVKSAARDDDDVGNGVLKAENGCVCCDVRLVCAQHAIAFFRISQTIIERRDRSRKRLAERERERERMKMNSVQGFLFKVCCILFSEK